MILDFAGGEASFVNAGRGDVRSLVIEERADPTLIDAAYPEIEGGVPPFIARPLQQGQENTRRR